jgi:hypothetical protein
MQGFDLTEFGLGFPFEISPGEQLAKSTQPLSSGYRYSESTNERAVIPIPGPAAHRDCR